jgi:aminoglycoside 6'-N-acetyltransferase I
MRVALWPDSTLEEELSDTAPVLEGRWHGLLPLTNFVAEENGELIGFIEVGLRSIADGCDPARAVGYLEGWYVDSSHRGKGVGAALVHAAEEWSRAQGCTEIASDTWIDNEGSQRAHEALGFEVVDRVVNYRKPL